MTSVVVSLFRSLRFVVRSRATLHLEIIARRHELAVVNRSRRQCLRVTSADQMLWAWLSRAWRGWRTAVRIVKPETVVAWHRRGFRLFRAWKSRHRTGRPDLPQDVRALIRELSTANHRQNAYVERVIGSIRRECLDHVIVANEAGLRRVLSGYVEYYMHSRTHLALAKDSTLARRVQPPSAGRVVATPEVGGLHQRYDRVAA